MPFNLAI